MKDTRIPYVHHTFNPWWGCVPVSPGCDRCYARTWARRWGKGHCWGATARRLEMSAAYWRQPLRWNAAAGGQDVRERVLCGSMCDVMEQPRHEQSLPLWREQLYDLIEATPHLDWLLITKRPQNFGALLPPVWLERPRPNVWLIATVESREYLWRIDELLKTPALVHGISIAPMLGRMELARVDRYPLDWVVLEGETGAGARPMDMIAAKDIIADCRDVGIPVYVKQLGEAWAKGHGRRARREDCPENWPEWARVREFPEGRAA